MNLHVLRRWRTIDFARKLSYYTYIFAILTLQNINIFLFILPPPFLSSFLSLSNSTSSVHPEFTGCFVRKFTYMLILIALANGPRIFLRVLERLAVLPAL